MIGEAMDASKVLYLDWKPQNILINKFLRVKLVDFGWAVYKKADCLWGIENWGTKYFKSKKYSLK